MGDHFPVLLVSVLLTGPQLLSSQAPISACLLLVVARVHHLLRRCNLILAPTAALVVTEVAQLLNTPLTQRTNLQLLVLAVFPTLLMDTLLQTTLAKIHTKTESLLIPITSN